jgi:hypothetical protein
LVPDEPKTEKPDAWANVVRVIEHYRQYHPRSFLKPNPKAKEAAAIAARLRDGRTVAELCECVTGYHKSPHHLGHNDRGTKFLSLELFMRDEDHVGAGIEFARNPPKRDTRHVRLRAEDTDWSKYQTGHYPASGDEPRVTGSVMGSATRRQPRAVPSVPAVPAPAPGAYAAAAQVDPDRANDVHVLVGQLATATTFLRRDVRVGSCRADQSDHSKTGEIPV